MSWEKYRNQIRNTLEELSSIKSQEVYLLKWLKIYRICSDSLDQFSLEANHKDTLINLKIKFKSNIEPELIKFNKDLQTQSLKQLLQRYFDKITDYFAIAEEYLKILPLKSLEVLEDSLFYVDLYRSILSKENLLLTKEIIAKKINNLKNSFEIEGGSKDLEQTQKEITNSYKNTLQQKEKTDNLPPENIKTISTELDSNIVLGQIKFPEELSQNSINPQSSITPINSVPSPKVSPGAPIVTLQEKSPEILNKVSILPYSAWIPSQDWPRFLSLRYSSSTGRVKNL